MHYVRKKEKNCNWESLITRGGHQVYLFYYLFMAQPYMRVCEVVYAEQGRQHPLNTAIIIKTPNKPAFYIYIKSQTEARTQNTPTTQ